MAKRNKDTIVLKQCPDCGHGGDGALRRQRITHRWIEGVEEEREFEAEIDAVCCTKCGAQVMDEYARLQKHEAWCRATGMLGPRQIRQIRRRLHLTIEQFAKLLGTGSASVGRWERGGTVQSRAYDRMMRLLDEAGVKEKLAEWSGVKLRTPESGSKLWLVRESGARLEWKFQHSAFYEPTPSARAAQDRFELRPARGA
jgi:putative zinc finger/helix-turn-helix YgiT family protein